MPRYRHPYPTASNKPKIQDKVKIRDIMLAQLADGREYTARELSKNFLRSMQSIKLYMKTLGEEGLVNQEFRLAPVPGKSHNRAAIQAFYTLTDEGKEVAAEAYEKAKEYLPDYEFPDDEK